MVLFQGQDATFWVLVSIGFTIATAAALWYFTIVGVDRKPRQQRRGEETIERYGDIVEDRAPVPVFLKITYVGVFLWGILYIIFTGINGTGL